MKLRRCTSCGRLAFPPRLWCPDCGGERWEEVEVARGMVETATRTREGARLATVVPEGAPPLLARLDDDASRGTAVALGADGGVPVATPGRPTPTAE